MIMLRLWLLALLMPGIVLCEEQHAAAELQAAHMPEAPAEVTPQTIDVKLVPPECVPSSLNTMDAESGGNWVIKRAFWEAAVGAYDKIVQLNDQLFNIQMTYVNKRNEAHSYVHINFIELGFDRAELSQLLIGLTEDIERERQLMGDLSPEEREELNRIKLKQKSLEAFKVQLDLIDQLDNSLDEVLVQLAKSINACRMFEKKAWENYKLIGKELNDKRARDLYYQMEGFNQSIQKQISYLKGELATYFSTNLQRVNDLIAQLKQDVEKLKAVGTDLKLEYDNFFKKDVAEEQAQKAELQRQLEQEKKQATQLAEKKAAARPWYKKMWSGVSGVFGSIGGFFTGIFTSLKKMVGLK